MNKESIKELIEEGYVVTNKEGWTISASYKYVTIHTAISVITNEPAVYYRQDIDSAITSFIRCHEGQYKLKGNVK